LGKPIAQVAIPIYSQKNNAFPAIKKKEYSDMNLLIDAKSA